VQQADMAVAQLKPKSKQPISLPFHALSIASLTVKKSLAAIYARTGGYFFESMNLALLKWVC
jgi:hypothetical protein